jgi:hypothetical protein
MLFQQTAAPTGWTKVTTAAYNNTALRFQTGTVTVSHGNDNFTTVFGSGKVTGADAGNLPAHTHITDGYVDASGGSGFTGFGGGGNQGTEHDVTSQSTGAGGTHTHTMTMNLDYTDVIIATKD